jgi:hypothetical protein
MDFHSTLTNLAIWQDSTPKLFLLRTRARGQFFDTPFVAPSLDQAIHVDSGRVHVVRYVRETWLRADLAIVSQGLVAASGQCKPV